MLSSDILEGDMANQASPSSFNLEKFGWGPLFLHSLFLSDFSFAAECILELDLKDFEIFFYFIYKKYYSYQSFWICPPPFFFPVFQLSTIFHLKDSKKLFYPIELLTQIQNLRIIKLLLQVTSFLNC